MCCYGCGCKGYNKKGELKECKKCKALYTGGKDGK